MNVILIKPSKEYETLIVDMLKEWETYNLSHKTDLSPRRIFQDYSDFDYYIKHIDKIKPGQVQCSTYFALDMDRNIIVGASNIRHELNEDLLMSGGHIGDGVRPSERRKGYATEIIRLSLLKCKELGIDKVLMCCNKDNIGSKKSIENNGGILENEILDDGVPLLRYWINI